MKIIYITILLFGSNILVQSQPSLQWAKSIGGSIGGDFAFGITTDATGNVYTTGSFLGTVDFDPGNGITNLTSVGQDDIFICKLNAEGNFVWAKSLGSKESDVAINIVLDANNNIYITGNFKDTVDFDPGINKTNLISVGSTDIFILKLNASGNFLWAKSMGGFGSENVNDISLDTNGNIYTVGYFTGTADFNPSSISTNNFVSVGGQDIFISKLNSSGNYVWAKSMGSINNDKANGIDVDIIGNIYTVGSFSGMMDANPGLGIVNLNTNGNQDIFISKLDAAGNYQWTKSMGSKGNDRANKIVLDSNNNIYTTGSFKDTVDFNPNSGINTFISKGFANAFILKLDAAGNYLCAKSMESIFSEGAGIALDIFSNVYILGGYSDTVNFNSGLADTILISKGLGDIFISKLDLNCSFTWVKSIGGTGTDIPTAITTDSIGNIYTTGAFENTLNFNNTITSNLTSLGGYDFFIYKMNSSFVGKENLSVMQTNIELFPNPTSDIIYVNTYDKSEIKNIEIYTTTGKLVLDKKQFGLPNTVNTKNLANGIYILKIYCTEKMFTKKIVVE